MKDHEYTDSHKKKLHPDNHHHPKEENSHSPGHKHREHEEHTVHENHLAHGEHDQKEHKEHDHHHAMMADFKKRFIVSMIVTVPVFFLSEMVQELFGLHFLSFQGDMYVLFILSSFVFFYGGYPFFMGLIDEFKIRQPGMMTLVAVAITTAYIYSVGVTFGLMGMTFYLELVTLIDIMLLGHWIEMRSVMGASRALQELATLLPKNAHNIHDDGTV